jgi:hypothetical protein
VPIALKEEAAAGEFITRARPQRSAADGLTLVSGLAECFKGQTLIFDVNRYL